MAMEECQDSTNISEVILNIKTIVQSSFSWSEVPTFTNSYLPLKNNETKYGNHLKDTKLNVA